MNIDCLRDTVPVSRDTPLSDASVNQIALDAKDGCPTARRNLAILFWRLSRKLAIRAGHDEQEKDELLSVVWVAILW